MIVPTPEQTAVLQTRTGPLRISAGAGTGKTTTVALLVADLVGRRGVEPERILGLTFTNKAAAELSDRIRTMLAPLAGPGREAEIHTYHGFAAQVVGEFGALVGVERGASVITPTFARQLLFEVVQHRHFEHFDVTWAGSIEKVQRLGASLGDHLADPSQVAEEAGQEEPWPERLELLAAWNDYQAEKQRLGVVDYADLIAAAVRLVKNNPDVALRLRSRYQSVLLDEYQDTNPAQRVLLQTLFGEGFPVVAVGDTDQTIYEWRGATPDNFERFPTHFPANDGSPAVALPLTINRRSDRRVLEVANHIKSRIAGDLERLQPGPQAGEGRVGTRWAADAVAEADWIADQAVRLHQEGTPWSQMAVLFRKNKNISLVHDALVEREIPVEVVNLGGLLSVPEVADVRAWMRILHSPEDGPALLRILMGPRMALGMGDLIHLTRWVAGQADDESDFDHERLPRHTMLEAIDHLEDIPDLAPRVHEALSRFRSQYRRLLEAAQGVSLAELARTILDTTGAWRDVEAMGPAGRLTARLNLYRFLDLTEEWSPLEGRPSLPAFIDHLAAMEENPAEELDAARLSGEEAMALLTIHRAKGLEWDIVFVPAVVRGTFPSYSSGFENPFSKPQFLPHEWRLDDPPHLDADMTEDEAKDVLRERHDAQEWRIGYVAATRARHRLFLSGAHWYGDPTPNMRPALSSSLYQLVSDLDITEDLGQDEVPPRPEVLRSADRVAAPDPLFPDGWAAAIRAALEQPDQVTRWAEGRHLRQEVEAKAADYQQRLFDLATVPTDEGAASQKSTSVTGLVSYAACPRRHYWSEVDRLPRRPSPAARRGVDVHRRIELHSLGSVPITELDPDGYDAVVGGRGGGGDPFAAYLGSDYARRQPLMVEVPFQFDTEAGIAIRGRIDAVYPLGDNGDTGWEIVDFKSGRPRTDPWLQVQLQAYAVASQRVEFGPPPPARVEASFVYLGDGIETVTVDADKEWLAEAATRIERMTSDIAAERFDPVPSTACGSCEFVRFCPAGTEWLSQDRP